MNEGDHIVVGQGRDYLHDLEGEQFRTSMSDELLLARVHAEQSLALLETHLQNHYSKE